MNIKKISIENFKGIRSAVFDLDSRFTVFIGENATGKTSILDALAVAIGSFFVGIAGLNSRPIRAEEIRIATINGQPKPQTPVSISVDGFVDGVPLSWKRSVENLKTTSKYARKVSEVARRKLKQSRTPYEERDFDEVVFPVFAYHGTGRLWAEHEAVKYQSQEEGVYRAYTNALSAKSSSKEFLTWFKTQEHNVERFNDPMEAAHLNAVKNALLTIIPDGRWQDISFDLLADNLVGLFKGKEKVKERLSYNQLSDGFRNVVGMVADIAFRCIQLNPHLGDKAVTDTPGVVLIDEIDLHLHPNWQRRIVKDLKEVFPRIQFVATTHSPFIVQSLEAAELISLDEHEANEAPNDLTINKVVTELMGVENIRGDDFERRYQGAKEKLMQIQDREGKLTTARYHEVREAIGQTLIDETNDPIHKAFLVTTGRGQEN